MLYEAFHLYLMVLYWPEQAHISNTLPSAILLDATSNQTVEEGAIRLVGGTGPHEGRVEIYLLGHWGTMCRNRWDLADATVVCRALGYSMAIEATTRFPHGSDPNPIWFEHLGCTGYEVKITDCSSRGLGMHSCAHYQDAGVVCSSESLNI